MLMGMEDAMDINHDHACIWLVQSSRDVRRGHATPDCIWLVQVRDVTVHVPYA